MICIKVKDQLGTVANFFEKLWWYIAAHIVVDLFPGQDVVGAVPTYNHEGSLSGNNILLIFKFTFTKKKYSLHNFKWSCAKPFTSDFFESK